MHLLPDFQINAHLSRMIPAAKLAPREERHSPEGLMSCSQAQVLLSHSWEARRLGYGPASAKVCQIPLFIKHILHRLFFA